MFGIVAQFFSGYAYGRVYDLYLIPYPGLLTKLSEASVCQQGMQVYLSCKLTLCYIAGTRLQTLSFCTNSQFQWLMMWMILQCNTPNYFCPNAQITKNFTSLTSMVPLFPGTAAASEAGKRRSRQAKAGCWHSTGHKHFLWGKCEPGEQRSGFLEGCSQPSDRA